MQGQVTFLKRLYHNRSTTYANTFDRSPSDSLISILFYHRNCMFLKLYLSSALSQILKENRFLPVYTPVLSIKYVGKYLTNHTTCYTVTRQPLRRNVPFARYLTLQTLAFYCSKSHCNWSMLSTGIWTITIFGQSKFLFETYNHRLLITHVSCARD